MKTNEFLFFIVIIDPTETLFQVQIKHPKRVLKGGLEIRRQKLSKSVLVLVHRKEMEAEKDNLLPTHYSLLDAHCLLL